MRKARWFLIVAAVLMAACGRGPAPPAGKWIGHYEASGIMVAVRLEIGSDGAVRVSAPNILNTAVNNEVQRKAMHRKLADELERSWSKVEARDMDFDGKIFRKPGGVAPQMVWNAATRTMKVVCYFGLQKSIYIDMRPVGDFSADPWAVRS